MLLINKEKGMSSFDVIRFLRKKLGVKKIGHAGTLDPLAEGLLIVLVGKEETKAAQDFQGLDKEYEAIARLGIKTDSGDLEGKELERQICKEISKKQIEKALKELEGEHMWQVPIYSAVKVDGRPLYKYARENKAVKIPEKKMGIFQMELLRIENHDEYTDVHYRAKVSSGTYIRVVSEKLGELLGCPATTAHIKRTQIGDFSLSEALKLDDIVKF